MAQEMDESVPCPSAIGISTKVPEPYSKNIRAIRDMYMAVNCNGEPLQKWLVDKHPHLNDVHQRVPS